MTELDLQMANHVLFRDTVPHDWSLNPHARVPRKKDIPAGQPRLAQALITMLRSKQHCCLSSVSPTKCPKPKTRSLLRRLQNGNLCRGRRKMNSIHGYRKNGASAACRRPALRTILTSLESAEYCPLQNWKSQKSMMRLHWLTP